MSPKLRRRIEGIEELSLEGEREESGWEELLKLAIGFRVQPADTFTKLIAAFTALLASNNQEKTLTFGRLFQSVVLKRFSDQLGRELKSLIDVGALSPEAQKSQSFRGSLYIIFEYLSSDGSSEQKLQAMKELLHKMIEEHMFEEKNNPMPQFMMATLSELTVRELVIMEAIYVAETRRSGEKESSELSQRELEEAVSRVSGVTHEYVALALQDLGTRRVIMRGTRLTDTGLKICRMIEGHVNSTLE